MSDFPNGTIPKIALKYTGMYEYKIYFAYICFLILLHSSRGALFTTHEGPEQRMDILSAEP